MNVLRKTDLRQLSDDDINGLLHDLYLTHGVRLEHLSREQSIDALVEWSYPVKSLPKIRKKSQRGFVLRSFVNEDDSPKSEGTNVLKLAKELMSEFQISQQDAYKTVELYKHDMVRYYGFTIVQEIDGVVMYSAERRKVVV
jgi:hypothetical protein